MAGWKKIGAIIGDTVARVALVFVFYLTVVPIHGMWVILKKDPMRRRWFKTLSSYFEDVETPSENHWERMF